MQNDNKNPQQRPNSQTNTKEDQTAIPSRQGEQSVSGTTPDVESDDDTLENAHEVGEQLDEDEEHQKK